MLDFNFVVIALLIVATGAMGLYMYFTEKADIEREEKALADMALKIKELKKNIEVLDFMKAHGVISAKDYAEELDRISHIIDKMEEDVCQD